MKKKTHNMFIYRLLRFIAGIYTNLKFKKKVLRNEIRKKKGPFVVIANHQCALDFMYMLALKTKTPVSLVISDAFYRTTPLKKYMDKVGVIAKQQFQTSTSDIKKMKKVIDDNGALVFYPAGLMCEDGVSTPIPESTYKFLKWLKADVFVAKVSGSYFVKPKWSKKMRPGRTYLDVYKLYDKETLAVEPLDSVKENVVKALSFDAYKEQETLKVKYKGGENIEGLENVLYACPHCKSEFAVKVKGEKTIYCQNCGFTQTSDEYGFMRKESEIGQEIRYPSEWNKIILNDLREKIYKTPDFSMTEKASISMIDDEKCKFVPVGEGTVSVNSERITVTGVINGEQRTVEVPTGAFASLPFVPGERLEVQDGDDIYRCALGDGKQVMKFVNAVKIFYELKNNVKVD